MLSSKTSYSFYRARRRMETFDQVQLPTVTHGLFSLPAGLREGESDSVFHPREGEGDSILRPRKGESDSFFVVGGRKGLRFGNRGAGCHHHHGGEMKFGHFREYHLHFRPQFPRSNSFPSSGDHGEETISSSFRSFPGEFLPQAENEESGFQPRERAFERVGGKPVFPEREHTRYECDRLHGYIYVIFSGLALWIICDIKIGLEKRKTALVI
jgi:hypothetical protein